MTYEEYIKKAGLERCIKDDNGYVVAWCVGYSDEELSNLLKRHPGWYYSYEKNLF